MNEKRLQAELWETQVWLMWILSFLLFRFGGSTAHVLGYTILGYSIFTVIACFVKLVQARIEDSKLTDTT